MTNKFVGWGLVIALLFSVNSGLAQDAKSGPRNDDDIASESKSDSDRAESAAKKIKLGATKNVTQVGNVYLAGQFTPDDIQLLKDQGIKTVVSLRSQGEIDWDEKAALEKAGIKFVNVPFRKPDTLTDDVFSKVRELVKSHANGKHKIMLHCGSANRVGAVWAVCRSCDQELELDVAIKEAKMVGLRSEGYESRAKDYIQRNPADND